MIKNIVFDIGNVLVQYSPRDVLKNYTNSEEDTEILLKEIFKSQEWQDLDWGRVTYTDATERMVNRLPERLEKTCRDIMETWITYALVNQKIVDIAKELKEKENIL